MAFSAPTTLLGPLVRATLALALLGLWMALLFAGHSARGATHLLLLAALVLYPWRAAGHSGGQRRSPRRY